MEKSALALSISLPQSISLAVSDSKTVVWNRKNKNKIVILGFYWLSLPRICSDVLLSLEDLTLLHNQNMCMAPSRHDSRDPSGWLALLSRHFFRNVDVCHQSSCSPSLQESLLVSIANNKLEEVLILTFNRRRWRLHT